MASGNPEIIYGVQLLDDLHNYFPDLLYNNQRFTTVQSVLSYITRSTRRRFDLFSYGRSLYNNQYNNRTRNQTDTKDDEDDDVEGDDDEETEDDEGDEVEDNENQSVGNLHVVLQSIMTQPQSRPSRSNVSNNSSNVAAPTPTAGTAPANAAATSAAAASMPVTPPPQPGSASARGASPVPAPRTQRTYASVLGGTPGSAYRTQNLFSLFPSFDNMLYSTNFNIPSEPADQIDINMNLLSALAGIIPANNAMPRSFLDPVPVFPTPAQVQAATTTRTLDADMDDNCSICQDSMRSGENIRHITSCNHTFHRNCIDTWFVRNVRCPVCRHDIRETGSAAPSQISEEPSPRMDEVE